MSEIIEKTYNFLDALDNSELIKNLTKYKEKLLNNKKVLSQIDDIKQETNDNLKVIKKSKLYENNDYKMYMKYYNELSLIILKINKKYSEYTTTKNHNCHE